MSRGLFLLLRQIKKYMQLRFFYFLFVFIFLVFSAKSQTATLTGKVTDASNGQILTGATITVLKSNRKTVSDLDGNYKLSALPSGTYTIQFTYVGYELKEVSGIEVKANEVNTFNITLSQSSKNNLEAVVVKSEAKKETLNSILNVRRNAPVVSDIISAEQIKRSPDKNISDVLKRVSGTSIQDNKFVVVRGMNDRYNEALLNGALLPSTEPDRKSFAFDIFPADVVDNITVIKSALPEYPASFAGGLVQVNLKDIPDKNFLSVKGSLGYNTITTNDIFYSDNGGQNFLGLDNGSRNLLQYFPSSYEYNQMTGYQKQNNSKLLANDWGLVKNPSAPYNNSYNITAGLSVKSSNAYPRLGGIFSVSHNENYRFSNNKVNSYLWDPNTPDSVATAAPDYLYNDSSYTHNILNSLLANVSFKLNPTNKFFFNNLYSVNATEQAVVRNGLSTIVTGNLAPYYAHALYFQSNQIYNAQLGGEHFIKGPKIKIKWLGYATSFNRDEPDYRQMVYYTPYEGAPLQAYLGRPTLVSTTTGGVRFFWRTKDRDLGTNIDLNKQFKFLGNPQTVKAGFAYHYDTRERTGRFQTTTPTDAPRFDRNLLLLGPNDIFDSSHINRITGFVMNDINAPQWFAYDGNIRNTAAYFMFDNKFTSKLRLAWGVRYEQYHNIVNSYGAGAIPDTVDRTFKNFLPSANFVYSVLPKANIRASYSQTVARPLYRELASGLFYDFFQNATFYGTNLNQTKIDNYEIRWEQYLNNAQYYSASIYYKKFKDPIEQKIALSASDSRTLTWQNAPSAENYGAEVEFRKNFDFISPAFANLFFYANAAYIKSTAFVKGNGSDTVNRTLQGQSPYLLNFSFQYSEPNLGLNFSALFNQIGERIQFVGGLQDAYIWEQPHALLDFKVGKTFLKNGMIEFTLADVLHKNDNLFWDLNDNKKYDKNYDAVIQSKSFGMNASLSISYKF